MKHSTLSLLFALATLFVAPPAAALQQESESPQLVAPAVPESLEQALELDPTSLVDTLAEASLEELQTFARAWTAFLVQQDEALEAAVSSLANSPRRTSIADVATDLDHLGEGAEVLAELLYEAGGDAAELRARIAAIQQRELERGEQGFTAPLSSFVAEDLSVEALRATLRPLTLEQVEVQTAAWMKLLQRKCLAVRNAEVAALRSESTEQVQLYSQRAVGLRGQRARLIERVRVLLSSLEEKGGDVTAQRAYVASVVEVPPIAGWRAGLATVGAWLTDEDGGGALSLALLQAALVLVAAWFAGWLLALVVRRAMMGTKTSTLLQNFAVRSVKRLALALGALIALGKLGLDMGPMLAAIGAAGLVIGLALQGTLSNIASGLLIMTSRPFDVGDLVSTAGVRGFVRGMTLITTRIVTFDNQIVFVPNNKVWGDVITNSTANKTRRVDLVFGISYGDDLRHAQRVLREVVSENPKVLADPEPIVRVNELGDSSVNFVVRPWVAADDYLEVFWDLTETVKERFDSEGISIPFPQRDVHLHPAAEAPSEGA